MVRRSSVWLFAATLAVLTGCGGTKPVPGVDSGTPLPMDGCVDNDGDGFPGTGDCSSAPNRDCNDNDPMVHPGATEICNAVDDNCDGTIDEGLTVSSYYKDDDGDGVGSAVKVGEGCALPPMGAVTTTGDCDDTNKNVHPGATELCNGLDDDCDGAKDNGLTFTDYYADADGDGYGAGAAVSACAPPAGKVTNNTDCNDAAATIHPGANESCNNVDDNCDGQIDNGVVTQSYYPDLDGDGYGAAGATPVVSCNPIAGKVTNATDCNDAVTAIHPGAPELCNGLDDNCTGTSDEGLTFATYYPDLDGDGYGSATAVGQSACAPVGGKVADNTDCNDSNGAIHPGATEVCNGVDDNCAGGIDEGLAVTNYYPDADSDGYGAAGSVAQAACAPVMGKVANNTDCNDGSAAVHPGATEVCNGVDDNCAGGIDEGNPGGGGACSTGQSGVCAAGTLTCTSGTVTCVRNVAPSMEKCNNLDDNCDGQTDEPFTTKGQACTAGLGVCLRTGTNVCSMDQLSVTCSVVAGPPSASACDGLDNDCDGVVDEPGLGSTDNVNTTTAWADIEVKPFYYSAGSGKGGTIAAGLTDTLVGGAMVMAGGASGIMLQQLTNAGIPSGTATNVTTLTYDDVDLAQSADGFLVAGLWDLGGGYEIDLYYVDGTSGAVRASLLSQFTRDSANPNNRLDSLRLVRGNGRRVLMLWRETGAGPKVGIKSVVIQGCLAGTTYSVAGLSCGALPAPTIYPGTGSYPAGLGADSAHEDWVAAQTTQDPVTARKLGVSWLTTPTSLNFFTINDDGVNGKSVETVVRTLSSPRTMTEPEVAFFRSGSPLADQFFVADVMHDPTAPAEADLEFWLTTDPTYHFAYLAYARDNGTASITRPRASATSSQVWMSAVRYDVDLTGTTFHRQIMTRQTDFAGAKSPPGGAVEISATTGSCTNQPASCRPGNKDGLTNWAASGRLYYSGGGASPAGAFASTLVCN